MFPCITYLIPGEPEDENAESTMDIVFGASDAQSWERRHAEAVANIEALLQLNIFRSKLEIREQWAVERLQAWREARPVEGDMPTYWRTKRVWDYGHDEMTAQDAHYFARRGWQ